VVKVSWVHRAGVYAGSNFLIFPNSIAGGILGRGGVTGGIGRTGVPIQRPWCWDSMVRG